MEPKERRNYPGQNIKDIKGMTVPFIFNYGITHPGSQDYFYDVQKQPEGFFIVPLGAGTIQVQLFGQNDSESYTIGAAEITAYTGKPLPYRIKRIISGASTTVTSMQIVW